jgi:hypothetical protein
VDAKKNHEDTNRRHDKKQRIIMIVREQEDQRVDHRDTLHHTTTQASNGLKEVETTESSCGLCSREAAERICLTSHASDKPRTSSTWYEQ